MKRLGIAILLILLFALQQACSAPNESTVGESGDEQDYRFPWVLTPQGREKLDTLIPLLAEKRVVFIGERHDRYDHHLNQLTIIRRLHEVDPDLAIGLEMFQQPFQPYLDAYIAGEIDEPTFLEQANYFPNWGFDYRLYRPILAFAREQGIPLLALNIPQEIVRKVGTSGLESLTEAERVWVPEVIDKSDIDYRKRLEKVFEQHDGGKAEDFEHFLEAQLLWDEAMAARAARYLRNHPDQLLVVLAGNGHLAYGAGIPSRLQRRIAVESAVILQGDPATEDLQGVDYLLLSEQIDLSPVGRLGVLLNTDAGPGLEVQRVMPGSGAAKAGMETEDRLISIEGRTIGSMEDVRLILWDKVPGESVTVTLRRGQEQTFQELILKVVLQE